MKNLLFYIFTLLLLLSQGKTTSDITGRWQVVEESPEGLHRILQFNSDGSFTNMVGATFKGTYKLQDNQLTIDSPQSGSEMVRDTQQISIRGDTLIIKLEGTQMEGIRLSPRVPDSPALVGRWQFEFPAFHGGKAGFWEFEFNKNGEFSSWIELYPQKGHYKIEGDLIVTTVDKETEISKFRFEDGFLLLKSPPNIGTEDKYSRIEKR